MCNASGVTVTEALVLRPLLEDRGRITESIRIPVPADRMKQKCARYRTISGCRDNRNVTDSAINIAILPNRY